MTDPSSPYYLRSGDQPGNLITHVIFRGDNYVGWSRAITLSLKARQKYCFVDGSMTKPTEPAKLVLDWETVNSMVVSWLLRSMEANVVASIPFHEEARALWTYLEKRFSVANGPQIQQLRKSITDCKQTKDMTVDNYFTTLMGLFDELNRLKPLHSCTCKLCTCDVAVKFAKDREEEKLHQFLIGIDDELFGTVRSNLLSHTTIPDLDQAYQVFLQEENSRAAARGKQPAPVVDVQAFAVTKARPDRAEKQKLICTHCKQKGHEVGNCFKLHGYPDWWDERNKNKGAVTTGNRDGTSGRGGGVRTHAISPTLLPAGGSESSSSTGAVNGLNELSKEQVHALLNLINIDASSCDRMSGPTLEEPDWSR
ncbi:unnamed protein product [Cuscuta epithymum]|uniref:Retrotransposon Copia-like N-terminal domain-containing protein n=1 Tax=Cuscuta epithymum TaxID=186058 RepID=A0AAV0CJI3_9ASTE|nr:unnamed protein product [Cuscuta epithymum]CAH9131660.1 unnamed protein product [Cuscuta epithymum]